MLIESGYNIISTFYTTSGKSGTFIDDFSFFKSFGNLIEDFDSSVSLVKANNGSIFLRQDVHPGDVNWRTYLDESYKD